MPSDRWRRLERVFTEAAEQPAGLRSDFLARACGPDAGMNAEVRALLAAADQSGDFLSAPALDVFARQVSREGWSVQPGDRVAAYTIERRLGAGGMGEVWRARDERLGRDVAIKLLLPRPSNGADRVHAFQREARAASALNHTNVLTVYDVGEHGGAPYLVTECLEGEALRARLGAGAMPIDLALDIGLQIARGLGAAHERGIVHRDLKPENVFLALDGRVKILDFGLATLLDPAQPASSPQEPATEMLRSLAAGTAGYMAPEQVRGEAVDRRADIFALGAVLYEMLAGSRPFQGNSTLATLDAVLSGVPADLSDVDPKIPEALSDLVRRCLEKSPADRFATVGDVVSALDSMTRARNRPPPPTVRTALRPRVLVAVVLLVILAMAAGAWRSRVVASRVRWAHNIAAPEIQRLSRQGDFATAYMLARQALDLVPDDPYLRQLWLDVSIPGKLTSDPPGADIAFATYRRPTTWFALGRTPLDGVRIPRTLVRVRISKSGFQTVEGSMSPPGLRRKLDEEGTLPAGMVRVAGGRDDARFGAVGNLDDFWIDRFEVTNRQFKAFVDHGGYGRREYWQEPFIDAGRSLSWSEGVDRFRDATGRPGPATWTSGTYPEGRADYPVGGVSWYEAAAYAVFAGKSLPTMYHWYRAADLGRFADILAVSNFDQTGPAPIGSYDGIGPFGTFDMAGNVKEWCWNETGAQRFLVGGGWNEPRYMFGDFDARAPFDRAPAFGFRLAKYMKPLPPVLTASVRTETINRDAGALRPVSDEIFAVYRRQYAYDAAPLNAVVEATADSVIWMKVSVALDTAYGERMRAYLFLPKNASPPYQTVIYFPAADAFVLRSSGDMSLAHADLIVRSGRAFLYPVYKGTYERGTSETGPNAQRDLLIAWSRDLGRSIDYLETRPDIDRARLAFYGVSSGADAGIVLSALEPRLKTTVLQGAGVGPETDPEIDTVNYAPRVRVPALLLNGRYDFDVPSEAAQRAMFDLLGTPAERKRLRIFERGHALPLGEVADEILPWLDRYLGPVGRIH